MTNQEFGLGRSHLADERNLNVCGRHNMGAATETIVLIIKPCVMTMGGDGGHNSFEDGPLTMANHRKRHMGRRPQKEQARNHFVPTIDSHAFLYAFRNLTSVGESCQLDWSLAKQSLPASWLSSQRLAKKEQTTSEE